MKILYTAFKGKSNSSKVLLDLINAENKLYVTNSFTKSVKELENELIKNYDLVISFGRLTLPNDKIKIETVGLKYETTYNYEVLKNKLEMNNYNVTISKHINYICGNLYYNGLKYIKENNLKTKMIFIHIPGLSNISNIENLAKIFSR